MNIFISYRRDDSSGYAGRLFDRLSAHFGRANVFMDIEALEPGADFVDGIDHAMASCEALIVLIGTEWLSATDAKGRRRLDNSNDFIRLEVANALQHDLLVLPVLVNGAVMPNEDELPAVLAPLARRQAHELSNTRWEYDVGRLIEVLERRLAKARQQERAAQDVGRPPARDEGGTPPLSKPGRETKPKAWIWPAVAVLLIGLAAWLALPRLGWPPPHEQTGAQPEQSADSGPEPSPEKSVAQPAGQTPLRTPRQPAGGVPRTAAATEPAPPGPASPAEPKAAERESTGEQIIEPPSPAPETTAEPTAAQLEPSPSPDPAARIEALLEQAAADFEADRLTRPTGANAYLRYQEILELAPGHPGALEGLRRLGYRYLELTAGALDRGRRDQANAYLDQAERFIPDEPELALLRRRLAEPPHPAAEDPEQHGRCLEACETGLAPCREEAESRASIEACLAGHRERCEMAFLECKNDPQRLAIWGALSTESACAGEFQQCMRPGEAACGEALEAALQACGAEAEDCRRGCRAR